MGMGSDEQLLSSGKIVADYAASKARLAHLMHEIASVANTYSKVADFIRTAHASKFASAPGIDAIPRPERVSELLKETTEEFERKSGLAYSLRSLGVDVEADRGFLSDPDKKRT